MHDGNPNGRANGLPIQGATPFQASQPRFHLVRATLGNDAQGIAINPFIYGEEVHYVDGRSHPCRRKDRPCVWCADGNRLRWYGYLPVVLLAAGRIGILELTERACTDARASCPWHQLRGHGVRVKRLGQSKRGRCVLEFVEFPLRGKLPDEIDTRAALDAIWNEFVPQTELPFTGEEPCP